MIASLLEKYRAAKAPVIHVLHETPQGAPVFTPGTELAEELAELKPVEGEHVVVKKHPGSFTETQLHELLQKTGHSKIVLTGYMVSLIATACRAARKGDFFCLPRLRLHFLLFFLPAGAVGRVAYIYLP